MPTLKKRKTPYAEGLPKKKKNFDTPIVSDSDNSELNHFIKRKEFTRCLDLLEKHGYSSEAALIVLAYLQGGVA